MKPGKRLGAFIAIAAIGFAVFIWWLTRTGAGRNSMRPTPVASSPSPEATGSPSPELAPVASPSAGPVVTPNPPPTPDPDPSAAVVATPEPSPLPTVQIQPAGATLLIPVAGIRADQLVDTFTAARSEGRVHDAIDIPAAKDTPVLAATDGKIIKLFLSKPGGITIYQLDPDNKTIYYYAHLEKYVDGLVEGHLAHRGETIAYVGDTGDAGTGNFHLHFSVSIVSDPKRWWEGTNINPFPLLTGKPAAVPK